MVGVPRKIRLYIKVRNVEGEQSDTDPPITTLTGTADQAASQGLLRRLYCLDLPLISVNCVGISLISSPFLPLWGHLSAIMIVSSFPSITRNLMCARLT